MMIARSRYCYFATLEDHQVQNCRQCELLEMALARMRALSIDACARYRSPEFIRSEESVSRDIARAIGQVAIV